MGRESDHVWRYLLGGNVVPLDALRCSPFKLQPRTPDLRGCLQAAHYLVPVRSLQGACAVPTEMDATFRDGFFDDKAEAIYVRRSMMTLLGTLRDSLPPRTMLALERRFEALSLHVPDPTARSPVGVLQTEGVERG